MEYVDLYVHAFAPTTSIIFDDRSSENRLTRVLFLKIIANLKFFYSI